MPEHSPTFLDRKPLFPGESCFPISPGQAKEEEETKKLIYSPSGLPCSGNDQMAKIISILGTPDDEETSFITDNKAIEYINTFPKCKRIDFNQRYPMAPPEAIDFLNRLLVFNPFFRMGLDEAISHPLFDDMRIKLAETSLENV